MARLPKPCLCPSAQNVPEKFVNHLDPDNYRDLDVTFLSNTIKKTDLTNLNFFLDQIKNPLLKRVDFFNNTIFKFLICA